MPLDKHTVSTKVDEIRSRVSDVESVLDAYGALSETAAGRILTLRSSMSRIQGELTRICDELRNSDL
jgi:hypothetical protein